MLTLTCAKKLEKLEGLAVEKQNLTSIPEDLSLKHDHGKYKLNPDNSGLKQTDKVSSKNVRASTSHHSY